MLENTMELERKIEHMLHRVEWIHPELDIYDGDHIACHYNGVLVCGRVSLSPRSIEVTISSPSQDVSEKEILDAEMPVIFTEHPYETSPASLVGRDRAQRLLLKLYLSTGEDNTV